MSLLFHIRCGNHPVGKGVEVLWSISCMVKTVGGPLGSSSQFTCRGQLPASFAQMPQQHQLNWLFSVSLHYCLPWVRPSGHHSSLRPPQWSLKWPPFSRFSPPPTHTISPICRQLSESSFKNQIKRPDVTLLLENIEWMSIFIICWERLWNAPPCTTHTLKILKNWQGTKLSEKPKFK